jgi:hypothetical protein
MIYLLNRFEQKIGGEYGEVYEMEFANFRLYYLLYSDADFPYDETIISEHLKIMSNFLIRRIALLKVTLYIGFIITTLSFLIIIENLIIYHSLLIIINSFSIVIFSTVIIMSVLFSAFAIFSSFFFPRKTKKKYPISFIIFSLIRVFNYSIRKMPDKINKIESFNKINAEKVDKIIKSMKYSSRKKSKTKMEKAIDKYKEESTLSSMRYTLEALEEASQCLDHYLPQRLRSGDIITDDWFNDSMRQVAAALREKKKWILTPKKDTFDNLAAIMSSTLLCIINGDWDALERKEPDKVILSVRRHAVIDFILKISKVVLLAVLPILVFLGYQLTPFAITGAAQGFVIVGLILWVGLTFLVRFDPDVNAKVQLLKDAKTLLSSKD